MLDLGIIEVTQQHEGTQESIQQALSLLTHLSYYHLWITILMCSQGAYNTVSVHSCKDTGAGLKKFPLAKSGTFQVAI